MAAEETEHTLTLEEYTALTDEQKTIWETRQREICEEYDKETFLNPTFEKNVWIHRSGLNHIQKNEGDKDWKKVLMSPRKYELETGTASHQLELQQMGRQALGGTASDKEFGVFPILISQLQNRNKFLEEQLVKLRGENKMLMSRPPMWLRFAGGHRRRSKYDFVLNSTHMRYYVFMYRVEDTEARLNNTKPYVAIYDSDEVEDSWNLVVNTLVGRWANGNWSRSLVKLKRIRISPTDSFERGKVIGQETVKVMKTPNWPLPDDNNQEDNYHKTQEQEAPHYYLM